MPVSARIAQDKDCKRLTKPVPILTPVNKLKGLRNVTTEELIESIKDQVTPSERRQIEKHQRNPVLQRITADNAKIRMEAEKAQGRVELTKKGDKELEKDMPKALAMTRVPKILQKKSDRKRTVRMPDPTKQTQIRSSCIPPSD